MFSEVPLTARGEAQPEVTPQPRCVEAAQSTCVAWAVASEKAGLEKLYSATAAQRLSTIASGQMGEEEETFTRVNGMTD